MKRWVRYDSIYNNATLLEIEVEVNLYDQVDSVESSTKLYTSYEQALHEIEDRLEQFDPE